MSQRRRLLAVSWALPPVLAPRAIQVARTLRGLADRGWDVAALAADPCTLPRGWRTDRSLAAVYPDPGWVERLSSRPAWPLVGRLIPTLRQRPDAFSAWAQHAVQAGMRMVARSRPAVLISFAQPWSCHLAGWELARRSGLPWIAHFSDPWIETSWHGRRSAASQRFNTVYERRVLERADAAVFVADEARRLMMRKHPSGWRGRTHVLPHSWDAALRRPPSQGDTPGRCRIVATGSLDESRDIAPLCAALRALLDERELTPADLLVRLIGPAHPQAHRARRRYGVEAIVHVEPPVDFARSLELMHESDVLLLLDAPGSRVGHGHPEESPFLASKTVEYLTARRPILGLTPLRSPSAALLRRLGCAVVPPDDRGAIAAALRLLVRQHQAGGVRVPEPFDAVADDYERAQVAVRWDALLSSVAMAGREGAARALAAV